ncbi:hypothetical protein AC579_7775 [Pseudocercospora musae]|uniref:Uncharacterized protein n=1 Tax=Pseudocercospora musae TaxID=113226 RepID=A0A139IJP8_9PEZI|nr:hypothetical protein AC579_7775 [Pseudocercospora musae]
MEDRKFQTLILKTVATHGNRHWSASLTRVAGQDRSKIHASRRNIANKDSYSSIIISITPHSISTIFYSHLHVSPLSVISTLPPPLLNWSFNC